MWVYTSRIPTLLAWLVIMTAVAVVSNCINKEERDVYGVCMGERRGGGYLRSACSADHLEDL